MIDFIITDRPNAGFGRQGPRVQITPSRPNKPNKHKGFRGSQVKARNATIAKTYAYRMPGKWIFRFIPDHPIATFQAISCKKYRGSPPLISLSLTSILQLSGGVSCR